MTWSQGQKDNFDKWLEWLRDTPLVHECGECGKVALLKAYHDGRKQFLGKVCSDKCAEQLREAFKRKCPNCLFDLTVNGKCPNYFGRCGIVQYRTEAS